MKIVSLLPSATEIVFALGLGDHLEGVTYECDFPEEARTKPVLSYTALDQGPQMTAREIDYAVRRSMDDKEPIYALDKDLIQRIQPDLILAQDLCRVCAVPSGEVEDALEELGCRSEVISLDPQGLDDVLEGIVAVGRATGVEDRARDLLGELRARVARVREISSRLPSIKTLAVEWSDPPFVGGHWVPDMIAAAGGESLLNEPKARSRTITWREAAEAGPEVLVFMPCGYYLEPALEEGERLLDEAELRATTAISSGSVFAVDATSYFSRPGPRLVDGIETLAWAIHPEAFPEPPPGRIARVEAAG